MALAVGTKLGPCEILAPIGAGGMGEVYRARDTKLQREVAIKVLPEIFANDPDRTARFTREALLLASLNHPGIAQIYGVEDRALIMELVPGPTLANRIASGPIPLDARVAIDRIRFAIRQTEEFAPRTDQMREVGFQLLDALDRLQSAERRFQQRFRTPTTNGKPRQIGAVECDLKPCLNGGRS